MKILSVEIENLFSIEKATVNFLNDGCTTIIDGEMGSGKSSIINSICFGLFGMIPKDVNLTKILRRGTKKGYSKVSVQVGEDVYVVVRHRPNKVAFLKNDEEVSITQEEFSKILGVSYDQFIIAVFFSQSTHGRFINLNDTQKKDFITRLLNFNSISLYKDYADKKNKEIMNILYEINNQKVYIEGQILTNNKNIEELTEINDRIKKQNTTLQEMELEYSNLKDIKSVDTSDLDIMEQKANDKLNKISEELGVKRLLDDKIKQLKNEINNPSWKRGSISLSCPSCKTPITLGRDGQVINNEEDLIKNIKKELEETQNKLNDITNKTSEDGGKIKDLIKKIKEKRLAITEAYNKDRSYKLYLESEINIMRGSISNLIENKTRLEKIHNKIKELEQSIVDFDNKIEEKNKESDVYRSISQIFSPVGLPAYITDNTIELFNSFVQKYVNILWNNIEYKIVSYKENSKGDVVAKYGDILTVGGEDSTLGNFSGGEFRLLSLCVDFAILDLLEATQGSSFSPIFLDEAFDGLDVPNKEKVVDLLNEISKEKGSEIVVIDHSSEFKGMFNRIISCKKIDKITEVLVSL
jgi:DNA repair exonuclease SbcCD ATPase subunit